MVSSGLLDTLAAWLRPLPRDGAPPAASVKRAVLNGLRGLAVDWAEGNALNALKKSGLGRLVIALSRDKEQPELSRTAEHLVNLWSRPLFNISDDLKMMSEIDKRRSSHQSGPRAAPSSKSALAAQQQVEIQQRVEQVTKTKFLFFSRFDCFCTVSEEAV